MSAPAVTWWGHATTTVEDSGVRVLADPVLGAGLAHLRRRRGPVPGPDARRVDAVVVSHCHLDHLHVPSLRALPADAPVLLPRGALRAVPGLRALAGRELVEVAPGDEVDLGAVRVRVVPAAHDGRRWPVSRTAPPALGFVVHGAARTYLAGDTDLDDDVVAAVDGADVAVLPVGGWGPGLGPGHLDARRAAELLARVGARDAVPVHWGTFWPVGLGRVRRHELDGPGPTFAAHAARLAPAARVHLLRPGATARTG